MISPEAKQRQSLERIRGILSRFNNITVFDYGDEANEGKASVYFDYGRGVATIGQKANFVDKLAKALGGAGDYATYITDIELVWQGDKGIDGNNEPFIVMEIPINEIGSIADFLQEHGAELGGNNVPYI